jgi:hypothetical protein
MVEALWFFGGALTFQIIGKLLRYGQLINLTAETGLHLLRLCAVITHDVTFLQTLKYKQLIESGVKEEQIQLIKEADKETLDNWKFSLILKFKYTLPKPVRSIFAFNDWDGAMRVLDKYLKKEKRTI